MPYVKVTGYIDVPDEDYEGGRAVVTSDGRAEIENVQVGDLDDLSIKEDDR